MDEGDIFSWCYTDAELEKRRKHTSEPYWCKSRMATVRKGALVDTYWYSPDYMLDQSEIVLTFLGNPKDMKKIQDWEAVFYRPEDIVSMKHSNNSGAPIYVKAGRDAATMREYFLYKGERFNSDIENAKRKILECQNAIAAIDRGELDGSFPAWSDR